MEEWNSLQQKINSSEINKDEGVSSDEDEVNKLVTSFSEDEQVHAKAILYFLVHEPFWNDAGEIVVDSVTVEGSNISELVKHAASKNDSELPVGGLQFYHILARKVPIELVQNDKGAELMMRNRLPSGEQKGEGSDESVMSPKRKRRKRIKLDRNKIQLKPWITINDDMVF
jgi:hypothetical protein